MYGPVSGPCFGVLASCCCCFVVALCLCPALLLEQEALGTWGLQALATFRFCVLLLDSDSDSDLSVFRYALCVMRYAKFLLITNTYKLRSLVIAIRVSGSLAPVSLLTHLTLYNECQNTQTDRNDQFSLSRFIHVDPQNTKLCHLSQNSDAAAYPYSCTRLQNRRSHKQEPCERGTLDFYVIVMGRGRHHKQ